MTNESRATHGDAVRTSHADRQIGVRELDVCRTGAMVQASELHPARVMPGETDVSPGELWAMSTAEVALTAHLVMPWTGCPPAFLATLDRELEERFGVADATIQIDPARGGPCARTAAGAV